jgi:aminoglycoside phosphotransferase (APT) family kinase protein
LHGTLGRLLGVGRTAEVFEFGDDRVIKLLQPEFDAAFAQNEATVAALVSKLPLGAPEFFGSLDINGRYGLVYERLIGKTMLDRLITSPWSAVRLADEFAQLHARMHDVRVDGLQRSREHYRDAVERAADVLGAARTTAVLRRLDSLADGASLSHGDMHPYNVIMASDGGRVIDWTAATVGPAEADVARSSFLLAHSALPDEMSARDRAVVGFMRGPFAARYLGRYAALRPLDIRALDGWMVVVYAARLAEGAVQEQADLLARIDRELQPPYPSEVSL